jgi:predicted TIM-barrel fold metal-dependent hydrolase
MNIFDCHFHIIDYRFPLIFNQGYIPAEFTCKDYCQQAQRLDIVGGAVVAGSFQGFDQTYLRDALGNLGARFVGVTQLPLATANEEIISLHKAGVRAVRFNPYREGSLVTDDLESFAKRIYELVGWHVELYVDACELHELYDTLVRLPRVVIDHVGLSRAGLPMLRKLMEHGGYVKASGFGRIDFDPGVAILELIQVNPDAVMFGTDLPSTRASRPFQEQDLNLLKQFNADIADKVLYSNAINLYKPNRTLPIK